MATTQSIATDAIQQLLDRQAILDCLLRYTRGVDRVDEELIRSAFHEDSIDFHGPTIAGPIDDFFAYWLPKQPTRHRAQHYVTNHSIDLDGDQAHVESYWICMLKEKGTDSGNLIGGRYVDRFDRRDGEWKIARRVVVHEWKAAMDFSPMAQFRGDEHWNRRDRSDPSYVRPLEGPPPLEES
jgi:hypothetical protein